MKYFKLLPALASIIALSATFVFARDVRGNEEDSNVGTRIETRDAKDDPDDVALNDLPVAIDSETGKIYYLHVDRVYTVRPASKGTYGEREVPT